MKWSSNSCLANPKRQNPKPFSSSFFDLKKRLSKHVPVTTFFGDDDDDDDEEEEEEEEEEEL